MILCVVLGWVVGVVLGIIVVFVIIGCIVFFLLKGKWVRKNCSLCLINN